MASMLGWSQITRQSFPISILWGGCHSLECDTITKDIWTWAIAKNLWLLAAFIPGKINHVADKMSQEFNPKLEWTLNLSVFNKIVQCFS